MRIVHETPVKRNDIKGEMACSWALEVCIFIYFLGVPSDIWEKYSETIGAPGIKIYGLLVPLN
jgi:hypothetical protein